MKTRIFCIIFITLCSWNITKGESLTQFKDKLTESETLYKSNTNHINLLHTTLFTPYEEFNNTPATLINAELRMWDNQGSSSKVDDNLATDPSGEPIGVIPIGNGTLFSIILLCLYLIFKISLTNRYK